MPEAEESHSSDALSSSAAELAKQFQGLAVEFDSCGKSDWPNSHKAIEIDRTLALRAFVLLRRASEMGYLRRCGYTGDWNFSMAPQEYRKAIQPYLNASGIQGIPSQPELPAVSDDASRKNPMPLVERTHRNLSALSQNRSSDRLSGHSEQIIKSLKAIASEIDANFSEERPNGVKLSTFLKVISWLNFVRTELVPRHLDRFRPDWPIATVQTAIVEQWGGRFGHHAQLSTPIAADYSLPEEDPVQFRLRVSADVSATACHLLAEQLQVLDGIPENAPAAKDVAPAATNEVSQPRKRKYVTKAEAELRARQNYKVIWRTDNQTEWERVTGYTRKRVKELQAWKDAEAKRERHRQAVRKVLSVIGRRTDPATINAIIAGDAALLGSLSDAERSRIDDLPGEQRDELLALMAESANDSRSGN